jgi:hypothetical protein
MTHKVLTTDSSTACTPQAAPNKFKPSGDHVMSWTFAPASVDCTGTKLHRPICDGTSHTLVLTAKSDSALQHAYAFVLREVPGQPSFSDWAVQTTPAAARRFTTVSRCHLSSGHWLQDDVQALVWKGCKCRSSSGLITAELKECRGSGCGVLLWRM